MANKNKPLNCYSKYREIQAQRKIQPINSEGVVEELLKDKFFESHSSQSILLLGEVQSGKTNAILQVAAAAVDYEFALIVILTTDQIELRDQTFRRAMCIEGCGEISVCNGTEIDCSKSCVKCLRLEENLEINRSTIVVLTKNSKVLENFTKLLSKKEGSVKDKKFMLIEDEGDAASLDINVNDKDSDPSVINSKISGLFNLFSYTKFVKATATPYALYFQVEGSIHYPKKVYKIRPGRGYVGTDFIYRFSEDSNEKPEQVILFSSEEVKRLKEKDTSIMSEIPGLRQMIISHLICCAVYMLDNGQCLLPNALIHTSRLTDDHNIVSSKVEEFLKDISKALLNDCKELKKKIKDVWKNLKSTHKSKMPSIKKCVNGIKSIIDEGKMVVFIVNSHSNSGDISKFKEGCASHIIIGGNSVGRGLTIPRLQNFYYTRDSKELKADTVAQHSRICGYDRNKRLLRVFHTHSVYYELCCIEETKRNFAERIFNDPIPAYKAKCEIGEEFMRFMCRSEKVKPTRKEVVRQKDLITERYLQGSVEFPKSGESGTCAMHGVSILDDVLQSFESKNRKINFELGKKYNRESTEITYYKLENTNILKEILKNFEVSGDKGWNNIHLEVLSFLEKKSSSAAAALFIRRNRALVKKTCNVVSWPDRVAAKNAYFKDKTVFMMYRTVDNHKTEQERQAFESWGRKPVWIPVIKHSSELYMTAMEAANKKNEYCD